VGGNKRFDIAFGGTHWHTHFDPAVFNIKTEGLALLTHDFTLKLIHRFSGRGLSKTGVKDFAASRYSR
jgi:hypothetical protein